MVTWEKNFRKIFTAEEVGDACEQSALSPEWECWPGENSPMAFAFCSSYFAYMEKTLNSQEIKITFSKNWEE